MTHLEFTMCCILLVIKFYINSSYSVKLQNGRPYSYRSRTNKSWPKSILDFTSKSGYNKYHCNLCFCLPLMLVIMQCKQSLIYLIKKNAKIVYGWLGAYVILLSIYANTLSFLTIFNNESNIQSMFSIAG